MVSIAASDDSNNAPVAKVMVTGADGRQYEAPAVVSVAADGSITGDGSNTSGAAASGSPVSGNPVLVGGSDGTNARTMKTDTSGNSMVVGNAASAATDSGNPVKVGGRYNTVAPTLTDGQRGDLQLDSTGALKVLSVGSVGLAFRQAVDNADAVAVNGTANELNVVGRNTVFNGTTWDRMRGDTNGSYVGGNVASGVTDAGNPVKVGSVAGTLATTVSIGQRVDLALNNRGAVFIVGGTRTTGADGQSNTLGQTWSDGTNFTNYAYVWPYIFNGSTWDRVKKPATTSRITSSAATTNATSAKASAGEIHSISAINTTASVKYLKIYNKASAPTVGTDTPLLTIALPPSNAAFTQTFPNGGYYLPAGIAYALTGAAADADTTALASGDVVGLNISYS